MIDERIIGTVALHVGITLDHAEGILSSFFQRGVLYPREKDWSFDELQAARIYPAPDVSTTVSNQVPPEGEHDFSICLTSAPMEQISVIA